MGMVTCAHEILQTRPSANVGDLDEWVDVSDDNVLDQAWMMRVFPNKRDESDKIEVCTEHGLLRTLPA